MSESITMNTTNSQIKSVENMQSAFDVMYQSFKATNDLLNATQHILDLATHITGAENSSLMLLNGHGQLYVLNSRGLGRAALKSALVKVGEGIAGQVVEQAAPFLVEDIASDKRFSSDYRYNRRKTRSFIACPITTKEKVIGVLNLNDKKSGEPFNSGDLDQAQLISIMAAVALRSFLSDKRFKFKSDELDETCHYPDEENYNNRDYIARILNDIHNPLNNIKYIIHCLKLLTTLDKTTAQDFYEIIEKEVNYLISCLEDSIRNTK